MTKTKKSPSSRKVALEERRAIDTYLKMLAKKPNRQGRRPDAKKARERLAKLESEVESAEGLDQLELYAEIAQAKVIIDEEENGTQQAALDKAEANFIKHAKRYSERLEVLPESWLMMPNPPPKNVLRKAGIDVSKRSHSAD